MELQTTGSGQTEIVRPQAEIFQLCVPIGRPAARNLFYSLCVHAAVVTALFTITLPATGPGAKPMEKLSPTELRLDGHLYYVSKIPAAEQKRDSTTITLPRAAAAGKAPAPAPPRPAPVKPAELPAPPRLNVAAPVPATPTAAAQIAATRQQIQRILARTFVPPEVKRNPAATQTLIQPLSPPDLVPPPTPLPSFRVTSPQFPRIPRQFVAPGRRNPTPPAQVPNVPVPNVELVHADPVPTDLQPKLALPRTPPPPEPTQAKTEGPPPAPAGDAANVLSLNDRPAPVDKTIVVPAGNIAQESGDAAAAQPGAPTASAGGTTLVAGLSSPTATSTPGAARTGAPAGTSAGTGTSATGTPAGASSGAGPNGAQGNGAAGASTNAGTGTGGSGTAVAGTGRGSVGAGIGSALAGASAAGSTTAIAGSLNPNAGAGGTGTGTGGTGAGRVAAGQVIANSPGGNYDAVVIQASPVDQYPETRGLLSGRPVYSVYISAGGARDWTLYFCVPNEKPPSTNSAMVQLDPAPAPIRAPYPYKLMRPAVTLPSWEKYVLVHGYVTTDGRFQEIRILRSILPETDKAILASLADWEFRAATKDGVPVRVEFLLSIPAKGL